MGKTGAGNLGRGHYLNGFPFSIPLGQRVIEWARGKSGKRDECNMEINK